MKKFLPILYTLYSILYTFAPSAHAQSTTLSVSPPVVEILLAPGKKLTQTFTLQTTGENVEVTPELHLATPSDDQGHMTIDPSPITRQSLGDGGLTITSSPPLNSPFSIQNSLFTLTLTLEAVNTDVAQDVYLALVFKTNPADSIPYSQSSIPFTPSISSLILVTINPEGATPVDLRVKDFTLPKVHDSWLPLTIEPVLNNNSPVMIRPHGLYEIISPSGKTLLSLPLYPNLILGNYSRRILGSHTRCEGSPHTGCVDPASPLSFTPAWHNLGPHRLRLTITTEGGTQIAQVEKTIWILPLRLTLICLVVLVLLASLILIKRRSIPPRLY